MFHFVDPDLILLRRVPVSVSSMPFFNASRPRISAASIALWVVSPADSNSSSMVAVIFIGSLHIHWLPQSEQQVDPSVLTIARFETHGVRAMRCQVCATALAAALLIGSIGTTFAQATVGVPGATSGGVGVAGVGTAPGTLGAVQSLEEIDGLSQIARRVEARRKRGPTNHRMAERARGCTH
jgi:hypothetical protein